MRRTFLLALLVPSLVLAQEKKTESDWRSEVAKHLTKPQIEVLASQKFVVGDEQYKQVFQPYLSGALPVFITSDSVLNAFHVLLEESSYQLERKNADRLPVFLQYAFNQLDDGAKGIDAKVELLASAKKRATIFLGVALQLNGIELGKTEPDTRKIIQDEVARIVEAKEKSKPDWLGRPDPGFLSLDYSRFKPRGFYTRGQKLERYFRVVSWLQAVPFHIENDEELVAALILSRAAGVNFQKFPDVYRGKRVLDSYGEFLGSGDDWNLDVLAGSYRQTQDAQTDEEKPKSFVERLRIALLKKAKDHRPEINDQLAFIPDDPKAVAQISIRVAAAYRLPDAVLFQRTTDPRRLRRDWPEGLEVAAALGSTFARSELGSGGSKELLATIDANNRLFQLEERNELDHSSSSLYMQYLATLKTLLTETEPDWPPFMKEAAWPAKTCQTALGGWSQMRHTWVLHAKLNKVWLSHDSKLAGFVEPVPEFYREFGRLCREYSKTLGRADAFPTDENAHPRVRLRKCEALNKIFEKGKVSESGAAGFQNLAEQERERAIELAEELGKTNPALLEKSEQFRELQMELLSESVEIHVGSPANLKYRWEYLIELCAKLECLSHKQLRGQEFAIEEKTFLKDYGERLGWLMFYDGNSYKEPRDDAPRIVDVFAFGDEYLEVGIGKPQPIYVLYPWHGKEIFCRGAVLPYHEFKHNDRLTDESWRQLLTSKNKPPQPAWTKILSEGAK